MIRAKGIQKSYGNLHVLKGLDLEVDKGEIVTIMGASGSGKSTLLHILGTIDKPDDGLVVLDGQQPFKKKDKELAAFRNLHIGFVFQFHHLLPEFTAMENICIPAMIAGKDLASVRPRALELMQVLGVKERSEHKPSAMSGGEQQRVAVARALINDPLIVLADEPTGNLDAANSSDMHKLFGELRARYGQTFLIATHNAEIAELSDRTMLMKEGTLHEQTK